MDEKLKAVILDDDKIFAEVLENRIERAASEHGLDFSIQSFQSVSELESNAAECDILFLDIELSGYNGMEWVQKWRSDKKIRNIIFVSAYSEYVFQSFDCQPIAFVRKTNLPEDLDRALTLYRKKISERSKIVLIPEGKKTRIFCVTDIVYLKGSGHYVEFYMTNGDVRILRGKMNSIEEIIEQYGFVRVKISCLINVKYISGMNKKQIMLESGEKFRVSPKYQEQAYEKLKIFMLGSGE